MASDALPWDNPVIAPLLVLWLYLPGICPILPLCLVVNGFQI
ncbi:MAG TPA: hypothetical protein QF802_00205 [Candidatus Thalassarchaeaceae archaeon]|nr:hypothetical protein [Candidatus Thalassarchaeaceae archaeon]